MLYFYYVVLALTYAIYYAYYFINPLFRGGKYEKGLKKIFSSTFYFILLIIIFNIDHFSSLLGEPASMFSPHLAENALQKYIEVNHKTLGIIVDVSWFIAIYDIAVSVFAVFSPPFSTLLAVAYKPYTHVLLSTLEGASRVVASILLLSYSLYYLIEIGLSLREPLGAMAALIIPSETRHVGKAALLLYIVLLVILPYTVNTSLSRVNFDYGEVLSVLGAISTPRALDSVEVDVQDASGVPLRAPVILFLRSNETYIASTIHGRKTLVLPRGVYHGAGVCIYWLNFSNSPCCYKSGYRECYGCYVTPIINTSSLHRIVAKIPFKPVPCNGSEGVAGLFYKEEGPPPRYEPGRIVFTLSPSVTYLRVRVVGGGFKVTYSNVSGWVVYYRVSGGTGIYTGACDVSVLENYYFSTRDWIERSNPGIYGHNASPTIGREGAVSEYTLEVFLVKTGNDTSLCPRGPNVTVTLYGSGCWNPRLAYVDKWPLIGALMDFVKHIENYVSSSYKIIVFTYTIFILWSAMLSVVLWSSITYPIIDFVKDAVWSFQRVNLVNFRPKIADIINREKKRDGGDHGKRGLSSLLLHRHERKIVENIKEVNEKIQYTLLLRRKTGEVERLLRTPTLVEKYEPRDLRELLYFMAGNQVLLEKLPPVSRGVIKSYPGYLNIKSPLLYNPRLREEVDKALIYYVSALKYGVDIPGAMRRLVNVRESLIRYLEENGKKLFVGARSAEELYDALASSRKIPDIDYMLLALAMKAYEDGGIQAIYTVLSPKMLSTLIGNILSRYRIYSFNYDQNFIDKIKKFKEGEGL